MRHKSCKKLLVLLAFRLRVNRLPIQMRHAFKLLGLIALLLVAQQGAVIHELRHVTGSSSARKVSSGLVLDATCAQCPAFAQVVSPAFSHSFHIPSLVRAAPNLSAGPLYAVINTAAPCPRSRGPPV